MNPEILVINPPVQLVTEYLYLPSVTYTNLTHTNTITMKKIVMRNISQFSLFNLVDCIQEVDVNTDGQPIINQPIEMEQNIPQIMVGE